MKSILSLLCGGLSLGEMCSADVLPEEGDKGCVVVRKESEPFMHFRKRSLEYAGPEMEDESPGERVTEVRIGWFGPSDAKNAVGGSMWWAASLAVEETNATGGFQGRPFRLLPSWTENPWGTGARMVTRLVYEDQVQALLGSVDGPATHLAEQIVAKARVPLVSPVSTDKSVNLAGVAWMFSCAPDDRQMARLLAQAVTSGLKSPNDQWVLCSATDHDSRMAAKEILRAFGISNRAPAFRFHFAAGSPAFDVQVDSLEKIKPSAIVISAGVEDAARLVKAIRQRNLEIEVFGTHQLGCHAFLRLAGESAEGVRFPLLFAPRANDPLFRRFSDRFMSDYGHEPDYAAALSYDATRMLVEAVRLGGLNRARIREALVKLSPWEGIAGLIRWDGTGQNERAVREMGTIRLGRIVVAGSEAP